MRNNTDYNAKPFYSSIMEEENCPEISDALMQITSLFDGREYKRCAFIADRFLQKFPTNQTILFFKVYSIYWKEKLKSEEEQPDKSLQSKLIRIINEINFKRFN